MKVVGGVRYTFDSREVVPGMGFVALKGEKAEAITLEEVSASYGNAQSEGFGGTMNWGGMQQRGRMEGFGGRDGQGTESESADGTFPARPSGRPDRQDFGSERPEMSEMPETTTISPDSACSVGTRFRPRYTKT